jgi:hypothetical protein
MHCTKEPSVLLRNNSNIRVVPQARMTADQGMLQPSLLLPYPACRRLFLYVQ